MPSAISRCHCAALNELAIGVIEFSRRQTAPTALKCPMRVDMSHSAVLDINFLAFYVHEGEIALELHRLVTRTFVRHGFLMSLYAGVSSSQRMRVFSHIVYD
jgi:hypothetical protein